MTKPITPEDLYEATMTEAQIRRAAADYVAGWDRESIQEPARLGYLADEDEERLRAAYGPENVVEIGEAIVAECCVRVGAAALGRRGGQAKTPRKADAVRANGRLGGRPIPLLLVDDLGRVVGRTVASSRRVGEVVEYGSRIARRQRPDGYVEPATFVVEGRARLQRPAESAAERLRRWDVQ